MPKLLPPLSKRHRRSRQNNLCNLVALHSTTTRIVSDEDMQLTSCSSPCDSDESYHSVISINNSKSSQVSSNSRIPSISYSQASSSDSPVTSLLSSEQQDSRLRRPTPSDCLVELAREDDARAPVTPPYRSRSISVDSTTDVTSPSCRSSPWGHFVDMQIPEEAEVSHGASTPPPRRSFLPVSICPDLKPSSWYGGSSDPYPRLKPRSHPVRLSSSRIPLTFSRRFQDLSSERYGALEGYVLTCPDMDDTVDRLESLSF